MRPAGSPAHETARIAIAEHITASPRITQVGLEFSSAEPMLPMPIFCSATIASTTAPIHTPANAARRARLSARRRPLTTGAGSRLASRAGRTTGCRSAGRTPLATASRWAVPTGAGTAIASS